MCSPIVIPNWSSCPVTFFTIRPQKRSQQQRKQSQRTGNDLTKTQEFINIQDCHHYRHRQVIYDDDDGIIIFLKTPENPIRGAGLRTSPPSKRPRSPKCVLESHFEIDRSKTNIFPKACCDNRQKVSEENILFVVHFYT